MRSTIESDKSTNSIKSISSESEQQDAIVEEETLQWVSCDGESRISKSFDTIIQLLDHSVKMFVKDTEKQLKKVRKLV